jgi:hypothetical protein
MRVLALFILFFTWAAASQLGSGSMTVNIGLNTTEAMSASHAAETNVLSVTKLVTGTSTETRPSDKGTAGEPTGNNNNNAMVSLLDPGFVALAIAYGVMVVGMLSVV